MVYMTRVYQWIRLHRWYAVLLLGIFILAWHIRVHNLFHYTTWWADDGGAHLAYIDVLLKEHRLPTMTETYLAWHEPGFYMFAAAWKRLGEWVGLGELQWLESLNIVIGFIFLGLSAWLAWEWTKERWVVALVGLLTAILFVGVKLSAYVNNELLAQTCILFLIILFLRWQLLENGRHRVIFVWSALLALATLVKITAVIVAIAAVFIWLYVVCVKKQWFVVGYLGIMVIVLGLINAPWLLYKQQHFGRVFSINLFEEKKQNILTSDAWKYIGSVNPRIFVDWPYWFILPHSFWSIAVADTFGDYYNLFNHVDRINLLPESERLLVLNGRFTTPLLFRSMLWTNRVGLMIAATWMIGVMGFTVSWWRQKEGNDYALWLVLLWFGGWAALLYNNLRLPYLERGVLKVAFIYYTFPLGALLAYDWWRRVIRNEYFWLVACGIPLIIYLVVAWPILIVS